MRKWIERYLQTHPKAYRVLMRIALYSKPLDVEKMIIFGWLTATFGEVEAKRWYAHIQKEKGKNQ